MMTPQDTAQYGQVLRVSVVLEIFSSRNSARAWDKSKNARPTPTAAVPLRNVRRCICIENLHGVSIYTKSETPKPGVSSPRSEKRRIASGTHGGGHCTSRNDECARRAGIGLEFHNGHPGVCTLDNAGMQWNLAGEGNAQLFGGGAAAPMLEGMVEVAASGTDVGGHVFDAAQHAHVDFLKHGQSLARIHQRHVLGRGDDDRPGESRLLRERELDVSGTGRQVGNEKIEQAPAHTGE